MSTFSGSRGFTQEQMDEILIKSGLLLPQKAIDEACNVLTLAGIIHRKSWEFYFTSPVFTKVLQQTYDLKYLFRKVKEEGYEQA